MVQDEWEIEMDRMVDSFAKQASISLEKIGQRFAVLGRSFDKDFRQNFMKMSNLRCDMIKFSKIVTVFFLNFQLDLLTPD